MNRDTDFSQNLKIIMDKKDMTQADLMRITGIPRSLISDYVNGKKSPALSNAIALAEALGVTLDELSGRTEEKVSKQPQDEPTPEEIQFLLEEMRAGRGSKEASILYYGGKPKPADEKMLEIEKAIDRRSNLQSMAEKTAELILDGENPAMLVSYINDKWEQIPLTEDELKAIRILLQK